jgi:diadenosine tetraphosphate (Ap4A) HIT family hydrolase
MSCSTKKLGQYGYKLLQYCLRFAFTRAIFIWWLTNLSDYLPVQKIGETPSLICFYHPQPSYPVHILFMPKEDIRDLSQPDISKGGFLSDLFLSVQTVVGELDLVEKGYRLIVNGGKYQEFPLLHFHLVSGDRI